MAMVYYRYRIMVRQNVSILLRAKRLFQQYLVDAYCKIETERLEFLVSKQHCKLIATKICRMQFWMEIVTLAV